MKDLIRKAGHKATPGRLAILDVLQKSKKPISIQELSKGLKGREIDQVTIYRNLDLLQKIGLVRKVDLRHGHSDYEFAGREDHHHLTCLSCGKMKDVLGCDLGPIIKKALRNNRDFAGISEHSLELFGLCRNCAPRKGK